MITEEESRTKLLSCDRRTFLRTTAVIAGGARRQVCSEFQPSPMPAADAPIATTSYGKVRGYSDNGINVFKGMRLRR